MLAARINGIVCREVKGWNEGCGVGMEMGVVGE